MVPGRIFEALSRNEEPSPKCLMVRVVRLKPSLGQGESDAKPLMINVVGLVGVPKKVFLGTGRWRSAVVPLFSNYIFFRYPDQADRSDHQWVRRRFWSGWSRNRLKTAILVRVDP